MADEERRRARSRALRAARAVSGLMMASVAVVGCGDSHETGGDAAVVDGAMPECDPWWETQECCEAFGGFWDGSGGCAVPGPFVPPALNA